MKKITVIRHGESQFNAQNNKNIKDNNLQNCGLTEFGKLQAKNLNQKFDILITSTLKRAIETFHNSNIEANNVVHSDLFNEQDYNLETTDNVIKRVKKAIQFISTLHYDNIGIISHGRFLWYFLDHCGQQPISLNNTQSITFNFNIIV